MVRRRKKSEKTSMLDRQIKKHTKNMTSFMLLEKKQWILFAQTGDTFHRDMALTHRYCAKDEHELLTLLCELKIRREVRRCQQPLKEK